MDFMTICQGLGLALAAGQIVGVVLPPVMPGWGVVAAAAPLAVIACGLALSGEGEPLWPALPIGVAAGGVAAVVARDVAAGAARRAGGQGQAGSQPAAGVTAIVGLAAILLAVLSLFVPPVAPAALVALIWLQLNRRRRAERKHEGLRVLR